MRRAAVPIAVCLALALLSTLLPWALAFDPEAWLVWGRESLRLDLATASGPSWKPLPVGVDVLLAPLGDAAPWAWLVVARAAGLAALTGAGALAWRLSGSRVAAAAAAALIALSPWWAFNTALGNSEGMLAAALLWAIVAHLFGRPRLALLLGLAAALLRPEVWPFLGVYALWLWRERPEDRVRVVLALAAVPLAWCVPELLLSGEPFRAAEAARGVASEGAAANAAHPWLEVFRDAAELTTLPVALAFAAAVARRNRAVRTVSPTTVLGAAAVGWVALVSAMTAAGFAGTPRYSAPAAALAAVVAATLTRRAAAALPLVALVAALQLGDLDTQRQELARRADLREQLEALVPHVCGPVSTDRTTTTTVAWHLDRPIEGLTRPAATDLRIVDGRWRLSRRCRP